jgi:biotin carboxyl carrier protein
MRHSFDLDGVSHAVWLSRDARGWTLLAERGSHSVALEPVRHGRFMLTLDGDSDAVSAVVDGDTVHVHLDGRAYALRYRDPVDVHAAASEAGGHDVARAPMPGGVLSVLVAVGATVRAGDTLLTIESMKLETAIKAGRDGTVETVHVGAGQTFDRDAPLVTLRRSEG